MSVKKISLVQPNFQQGPKEFNAHYLPYSVGVLWSYVQQFEEIKTEYELDKLLWRRTNIKETALSLVDNHIVAFSTYVWNKSYNYAVAQEVKRLNPNVILIFGGPEIPITKKDIFERYPFMDIVIKSEGEITFKNVLLALKNVTDLRQIPGLIINVNNHAVDTGDASRIDNLDQIPSPYLTGVFDKLMAETQGVEWNATLETNRGCPYACTFCDWGSLTYNKVKKFNLERVFAELEWIGKNKCGFVSITDANFGMFVERDNLIADKLLEVQEKYGYPYTFSVAWAKNQKAEVVDIVKKLIKSPKFNQGLTVSVQSMDLDVLENIKRKNLDQHKIEDIFSLCDKNSIPVYTEVILGLPGETLDTWREGFYKLFRANNHVGITILHAQMLENAEMNLLQQKLYKIEHRPVYDYMSGSYNFDELKESVEVVISTKDMSTEDMLEAHAVSWFLNTFHINGLTTYISRFLHKQNDIDYRDFYDKLYKFVKQDPWFQSERDSIKKYYRNWMLEGSISHPDISNIEVHGWNLVHRTILNMHAEKKYDYVFNLIERFVKENFDIEEADQLLEFNRLFVIDYDKIKSYPLIKTFDYDFLGYIQDSTDLCSPTEYKFDFLEDKKITIERFLENIYFSRRRNFGKAWITRTKK
jgi:tRNA A37 methylthiotransferase MiaB